MLIRKQELIEKAFCEGYSYAQREFSGKKITRKRLMARNAIHGSLIGALAGMTGKNPRTALVGAGLGALIGARDGARKHAIIKLAKEHPEYFE